MTIPFNEFYPEVRRYISRQDNHLIKPVINREQRVQFQARAHEHNGRKSLRGFNLRYERPLLENGLAVTSKGDIPVLQRPEVLTLIRKSKASLGYQVYNALSAPGADSQAKMKNVHDAFAQCDERVRWMRDQCTGDGVAAGGCKAQLGEEMYDLLSNIAGVDNMERRADEAYFKCLKNMSDLNVRLTPGQEEELSRWVMRRFRSNSDTY